MILQGKAKDFFLKWLCYGNDGNSNILRSEKLTTTNFIALKETCQHALIVEWLDSVGIYINIKSKFGQKKQCERFSFVVKNYNSGFMFNSRIESTTKAIEKAVEIYNLTK